MRQTDAVIGNEDCGVVIGGYPSRRRKLELSPE
jgi:hypothetical protein